MKKKTTMTVADSRRIAQEIWSLELAYAPGEAPDQVRPGQFAGIYPTAADLLLMRPISICRWDPARSVLRFVYRAAGKGTKTLTELKAGDRVDMLGILGNGYDLDALAGRRVLLLGGGIGIPPMLELAASLSACKNENKNTQVTAILGYRDGDLFLKEEMEAFADVLVATEDGSAGTKGNVLDVVREKGNRSGCDLRLRPPSHAPGGPALCHGERDPRLPVAGGAHGLRRRRVPGLCCRYDKGR